MLSIVKDVFKKIAAYLQEIINDELRVMNDFYQQYT